MGQMAGWMVEQNTRTDGQNELERLSRALHDLCQPLTTLQCRLELAGVLGTAAAYREAVEHGLDECGRLIDAVESMRGMVRGAAQRVDSAGI
jgi:hypothetical protein